MERTLHQRLIDARVMLQSKSLKKSGNNTFSKAKYYELADFLPAINEICKELNLLPAISFTNDLATLTIHDALKPSDSIVFTSPMSETQLKNCHPVQNLGATETYTRRYLYTTAFEIVESDWVDASDYVSGADKAEPKKSEPKAPAYISGAKLKELMTYAQQVHGADAKACFTELCEMMGAKSARQLPDDEKMILDFIDGYDPTKLPFSMDDDHG